jgi:hypothetical protein
LKYFAGLINSLGFSKVTVLDPLSYVSEALIDHIQIQTPKCYVERVLADLSEIEGVQSQKDNILLFYPDEGAMKRYAAIFDLPYVFGMKKRNWTNGEIQGLEVLGQTERIAGSTVLIIDDICSRGGTFYFSAKALKELGLSMVARGSAETITAQLPEAGQVVPGGSQVLLYFGDEPAQRTVEVPDFTGMTRQQASDAAGKLGLYILVKGNSALDVNVRATSQSIGKDTVVPVGTTIEIEFTDTGARD